MNLTISYNVFMTQVHLPEYITQYFWGDTVADLDIDTHKKYIIQTILGRIR